MLLLREAEGSSGARHRNLLSITRLTPPPWVLTLKASESSSSSMMTPPWAPPPPSSPNHPESQRELLFQLGDALLIVVKLVVPKTNLRRGIIRAHTNALPALQRQALVKITSIPPPSPPPTR